MVLEATMDFTYIVHWNDSFLHTMHENDGSCGGCHGSHGLPF